MRFFACLSRTKRSSSTAAINLPSMYRAADGSWLSAPDRPRMVNATGKPLAAAGGRAATAGWKASMGPPNEAKDDNERTGPRVVRRRADRAVLFIVAADAGRAGDAGPNPAASCAGSAHGRGHRRGRRRPGWRAGAWRRG